MGAHWFVFAFCVLVANAHGGIFSEHLSKYINNSIEPCNDFYDHVCSAVPEDEFFKVKVARLFREKLAAYKSKEIVAFIAEHTDFLERVNMRDIVAGFEEFDALYKYIETKEFQKKQNEFQRTFGAWKSSVLMDLTEAPWTSHNPKFVDWLRNAELASYEQPQVNNSGAVTQIDLTSAILTILEELKLCSQIDDSREEYNCADHVMITISKLLNSMTTIHQTLYSDLGVVRSAFSENAHVFPPYYAIDYEDNEYLDQTLYLLFGNVLGGSFFHSKKPTNTNCLKTQMTDSCLLFQEAVFRRCLHDATFAKDAADWVALKGVASIAKESDLNEEINELWKNFFYSYAIQNCESKQSSKIRVNGILRLFPEFTRTFSCKLGNRMINTAETCDPFTGLEDKGKDEEGVVINW